MFSYSRYHQTDLWCFRRNPKRSFPISQIRPDTTTAFHVFPFIESVFPQKMLWFFSYLVFGLRKSSWDMNLTFLWWVMFNSAGKRTGFNSGREASVKSRVHQKNVRRTSRAQRLFELISKRITRREIAGYSVDVLYVYFTHSILQVFLSWFDLISILRFHSELGLFNPAISEDLFMMLIWEK